MIRYIKGVGKLWIGNTAPSFGSNLIWLCPQDEKGNTTIFVWDIREGKYIPLSSGSGAISIDPNHFFASSSDRDTYFASHPDELIDGATSVIETNPATLWQYNGKEWKNITTVIQGPKGDTGDVSTVPAEKIVASIVGHTRIIGSDVQQQLNSADSLINGLQTSKQDKLTPGANITISANNVISATGGSSSADKISVDNSVFENIEGANVQDALKSVDSKIAAFLPTSVTRTDVTNMFTTNVPVTDFRVEKVDYGSGKPMIRMFAQDTSGTSNTLVVTASLGFGSYYAYSADRPKIHHGISGLDGDGNPVTGHYSISITPETDIDKTVITFDSHIHDIDLTYWLGATKASYYIDTIGVTHPLTYANTKIDSTNLCSDSLGWTLEGHVVDRRTIRELHLGNDYDNSVVPFVNDGMFFYGAAALTKVILPSNMTATAIDVRWFDSCDNLREINWRNFDPSGLGTNINAFRNVPNDSTCIRRHTTQALADAVLAKFPLLSNWTVIIEP